MGRRGGANRAPNKASGSNDMISLREELTGRKQTQGGSISAKSAMKLKHLQKLALWAGAEASVPSLGAFFGCTLASAQEGLGVPPDPSLFTCQRCETILQPGFNCTVRIEKNRAKEQRRSKKPSNLTQNNVQNNVVYACHFCSHRNLKRGTPNGHMKVICPPKAKTTSKSKPATSISKKFVSPKNNIVGEDEVTKANEIASSQIAGEIHAIGEEEVGKVNEMSPSEFARGIPTMDCPAGLDEVREAHEVASSVLSRDIPTVDSPAGVDEVGNVNEIASSAVATDIPNVDSPSSPMAKTGTTLLLGGKRRKRKKSATKKPAEPENSPVPVNAENTTSKKRRRKSWTSLKEIVESNKQNNVLTSIPFFV